MRGRSTAGDGKSTNALFQFREAKTFDQRMACGFPSSPQPPSPRYHGGEGGEDVDASKKWAMILVLFLCTDDG